MQPDSGTVYGLLASAKAAAGQTEQAIALYRRALELQPREAAHYNNLGALLVRRGELEEGLSYFDRAARLEPGQVATCRFNRGAALLNAGRVADAVPALREAVERDPTLAVAHYFLGLALLRTSPRKQLPSGKERIEPRSGTLEAFERYLRLAPEGEYAEQARNHLEEFGALPPQLLLPTPNPEVID